MVEVNITVEADDTAQLQDILNHIVLEITDGEYRLRKMNDCRKVDMNWVYTDEGRYQWARSDKS